MIRQATLPLIFALSPTLSKEDAALERQLRRAVARKQPIVIGSTADPYDPVVQGTARSLLETFLRQEGLEISIVTHSPRIQNDLELLVELDKRHSVKIRMVVDIEAEGANPAPRMRAARALASFDRQVRRGPKEFSWFIYRVTHPTMRDMFMAPSNVLRVKEALLSMLAGDIYGKTPIWGSLRVLKGIFYISSALNFRRTLQAMRLRKANIRDVEVTAS